MKDVKAIIAGNVAALRQGVGMTQLEFAEKLNYSDKAISKWERGESIPDVTVLLQIAELFGVTLNYLVEETHPAEAQKKRNKLINRGFITGIAILLVWLIATFCFMVVDFSTGGIDFQWLAFVYAVPISMIVWLVCNSVWFNQRRNYLIISLLMWSVLVTVYLTFLPFGYNLWLIFSLGVPGQVAIIFWSRLKYRAKPAPAEDPAPAEHS